MAERLVVDCSLPPSIAVDARDEVDAAVAALEPDDNAAHAAVAEQIIAVRTAEAIAAMRERDAQREQRVPLSDAELAERELDAKVSTERRIELELADAARAALVDRLRAGKATASEQQAALALLLDR